ncbi:MAG: FAD-dependent thymidylate synthase [Candidatus Aenigmatarchaeota archaeon]
MAEISYREPKVSVAELPANPEHDDWGATEATVYNTRISGDPEGKSSLGIWKAAKEEMSPDELKENERKFIKDTLAKQGHISAFYQADIGLNYEIPRSATLYFCSFDHPKYLQQSQRYTEAKDFISPNVSDGVNELFAKQSKLYNEMIDTDIPKEDARYILPLGTAATHLHQKTNLAGLMNIHRNLKSENTEIPDVVEDVFYEAINELNKKDPLLFNEENMDLLIESGKGYPVANMFCEENKWVSEVLDDYNVEDIVETFSYSIDQELKDESRNLNDEAMSFVNLSNDPERVDGYVTSMSLSAWHQFMRNDTVKNAVESLYDAAEKGRKIVPSTVEKSSFEEEFVDLVGESMELYHNRKKKVGKANAAEVIPHCLDLGIVFSLDGFNRQRGFMPDRTQEAAQWEIRGIARKIDSEL